MRSVVAALCLALAACGGGGGGGGDVAIPAAAAVAEAPAPQLPAVPLPPVAAPPAVTARPAAEVAAVVAQPSVGPVKSGIAVWGDSLAYGLVQQLQALMPDRALFMGGIGGETSTQIRARLVTDTAHRNSITVIWAGRNNADDLTSIRADVEAMVALVPDGRFLVLGIINGSYDIERIGATGYITINNINLTLGYAYGSRFLDVRKALVAAYKPGDSLDEYDFRTDTVPLSLRMDDIHLNGKGAEVVARQVQEAIQANGW
jgi:lysophospholipase L1-like esterase